MKRVIFDIFLAISIFLLPWWATISLAVIGLFIFANYYEFIACSVIVYIISAPPSKPFLSSSFLIYSSIIVFYLLVQTLRRHIILYKNEIPYKT